MLKDSNSLLKLQLETKKSILIKVYQNIFESLYQLFEIILDDPIENFTFEVINIFIGYLQIIIFIFNETVSRIIIIFLTISFNHFIVVFTIMESKFYN